MAFTGERERSYLLLVDFPPLDDLAEATAHVVELEVSARLRARVLVVRVILEVDALVVHQILLMIDIVCHFCFSSSLLNLI